MIWFKYDLKVMLMIVLMTEKCFGPNCYYCFAHLDDSSLTGCGGDSAFLVVVMPRSPVRGGFHVTVECTCTQGGNIRHSLGVHSCMLYRVHLHSRRKH